MQAIRQTQQLNKRELENAIPPSASWHADYRDTAWIYAGGLPFDLTEGDVVTIFSQFGNPTHLNLIRDKETGKSKGFAFLKYEDQRSCDLAVDNLTGADVLGKLLRVDHTRYKKREDEDEDTYRIDILEAEADAVTSGRRASDTVGNDEERRRRKKRRPTLKDEPARHSLTIKENGENGDPISDSVRRERTHHHRRRHEGHENHNRRQRDEAGSDRHLHHDHDGSEFREALDNDTKRPSHQDRKDDRESSQSRRHSRAERTEASRRIYDRDEPAHSRRRHSNSESRKSRGGHESDDEQNRHRTNAGNGKRAPHGY